MCCPRSACCEPLVCPQVWNFRHISVFNIQWCLWGGTETLFGGIMVMFRVTCYKLIRLCRRQHLAPNLFNAQNLSLRASWPLSSCNVFHFSPHNFTKGTARGWGSVQRRNIRCITGPGSWDSRWGNGPSLEFYPPRCSSSCFHRVDALLRQKTL